MRFSVAWDERDSREKFCHQPKCQLGVGSLMGFRVGICSWGSWFFGVVCVGMRVLCVVGYLHMEGVR